MSWDLAVYRNLVAALPSGSTYGYNHLGKRFGDTVKNSKKLQTLAPVIPLVGPYLEELILNMKKHHGQHVYCTIKYKKLQTRKQFSLTTQWVNDISWHLFGAGPTLSTVRGWSYELHNCMKVAVEGLRHPAAWGHTAGKWQSKELPLASSAIQVVKESSTLDSTLWCWEIREAVCIDIQLCAKEVRVSKLMSGIVLVVQLGLFLFLFCIF